MSKHHRRLQVVEDAFGDRARFVKDAKAVRLAVACDRLGISVRTGQRLLREGRFPIPELPRIMNKRGCPHLFSTVHIDAYLATASVADVR